MNNLQDIFNAVIAAGFYKKHTIMCPALKEALSAGLITEFEYEFAVQSIKKYLKAYGSLGGLLMHNKLPYEYEARLAIYQDWCNKPNFDKE